MKKLWNRGAHVWKVKLPEALVPSLKTFIPTVPIVSPKNPSETPPLCQFTPKMIRELSTKSPANKRLTQLRDDDAEMTDLSVEVTEFVEQMDWEDISEKIALQEVVTVRQSLGLKQAGGLDTTSTVSSYFSSSWSPRGVSFHSLSQQPPQTAQSTCQRSIGKTSRIVKKTLDDGSFKKVLAILVSVHLQRSLLNSIFAM